MSGGRYRRAMVESFAWREIGQISAGPRLAPPGPGSHSHSARTVAPRIKDANAPDELSGARADGWDCPMSLRDCELLKRRRKCL